MIKALWQRYGINPFNSLLKRAQQNRVRKILIVWNRGMGDIPLGLYGLNFQIRKWLPDAEITYLTRSDLEEGFELLGQVRILAHPDWRRYQPIDIDQALTRWHLQRSDFDWVLEKPDPTEWLVHQRGELIPRLQWKSEWEALAEHFAIDPKKPCLGVHFQTETFYSSFDRNWPLEHWKALFEKVVQETGHQVLLFGFKSIPPMEREGIIDLRGRTTLREMLALIKRYCTHLVLPDSGPLAMVYYLDTSYPLRIVSLWADPRHGVLKQAVPSPNPLLQHIPLISPKKRDLSAVSVNSVFEALNCMSLSLSK